MEDAEGAGGAGGETAVQGRMQVTQAVPRRRQRRRRRCPLALRPADFRLRYQCRTSV